MEDLAGPELRADGAGAFSAAASDGVSIDITSPARFTNRELSWLDFNQRVLDEAANPQHPLLERLRFLSISANNLNEFYMVRVAGLKGQIDASVDVVSQEGLTPRQQLQLIHDRADTLMRDQQNCWVRLRSELADNGILVIHDKSELSREDLTWLDHYFTDRLFSVLTPIALDPAHPFPFLPNLGFAMVLALKRKRERDTLNALVPLPQMMDRFIFLPGPGIRYITLETIVALHMGRMFPGFTVAEVGLCRVLRDSDIEIEDEAGRITRWLTDVRPHWIFER